MKSEMTFSLASLLATGAWLLLAVAAAMRPSRKQSIFLLFAGRTVPLALCGLYVGLLIIHLGSAPKGGLSSLAGVMALFAVPGKMLGGWVHFLAFDLLIGRGMVDHALAEGRSRAPLIVSLPLTFMYGPAGVLCYVLCQLIASRTRIAAAP